MGAMDEKGFPHGAEGDFDLLTPAYFEGSKRQRRKRSDARQLKRGARMSLEIGFKPVLDGAELEWLKTQLIKCCSLYALSSKEFAEDPQSTDADWESVSENPIRTVTWYRILAGLRSGVEQCSFYWLFAKNLADLPRKTLGGSDTRLVRICALRVAAIGYDDTFTDAALFDLLGMLVEILADPAEARKHKLRATRLFRTVLSDLHNRVRPQPDDSQPRFWSAVSTTWLEGIASAAREGLLPDDTFARKACALFAGPPANQSLSGLSGQKPQDLVSELPSAPALPLDRPAMHVMKSLDLTALDPQKAEYAKQFECLTEYLPLAPLPSLAAMTEKLGELQCDMPNFGPVIQSLQADFALARRSPTIPMLHFRPLLIVGPPGIGKTRFVKELANALGAVWALLPTAGDADNRRFAGTARGFTSAHPSWPVDQIRQLGHANPILVLDEIEKAGGCAANGMLAHSVLPLLESETAKIFSDPFLGGPVDLSAISWIFLANTTDGLSAPLLSRVTKFHIEPPDPAAFAAIVLNIRRDFGRTHGIEETELPAIPAPFLKELKAAYAKNRDIRRLRAVIEKAMGIIARCESEHFGELIH
jgi:ATPase family associated with various cellular activities (AAA)